LEKLEFFNVANYKKCCPLKWGPGSTLVFGVSKTLKFYQVLTKRMMEVALPVPCSSILWLQKSEDILIVMNKQIGEKIVHGRIGLVQFKPLKPVLHSVYTEGHKIEI
jgi:hypothetical protein